MLLKQGVLSGRLPRVPFCNEIAYATATAILFHFGVTEPQSLKASYFSFLNRITENRYISFHIDSSRKRLIVVSIIIDYSLSLLWQLISRCRLILYHENQLYTHLTSIRPLPPKSSAFIHPLPRKYCQLRPIVFGHKNPPENRALIPP